MKFLFQNKLGRIWFLVWFIGIAIYLIVKAIRRYIEFKTLQFDIVFEREIDGGIMNFYLTCIILAIFSSILCVYCIVFRTGNYANDSMQFGEGKLDFKVLKMKLQREQISRNLILNNSCYVWQRIKCHFPPYHLSLYFSMSVTLLLALPYLESEKIKNGFGRTNSPRHTNLDVIFSTEKDNTFPNDHYQDGMGQPISFEFFNLCISLLLHTFSYSHVFWKYNKKFSLLFSFVIFLSGLIFILDMALVEMLIKVSRYQDPKLSINSPPVLTILSLMAYFLLIIHQMALFEYGYIRLTETLLPRFSIETIESCQTYNDGLNVSIQFSSVCKQLCVESWGGVLLPFVIGILSTVLNISVRLTYIYKSMTTIYPQFKDALILANLVFAIIFLILMLILWVSLIMRSQWPLKTMESLVESNGDCAMQITRHHNHAPSLPIYASINRHPMSSPPLGQEPNFPVFCDQVNNQWRYSCSPPSCGANDSNSDRTTSCKNGDISNNNRNYLIMRRSIPATSVVDVPKISHGIYSQLIKLTPQNSHTDNFHPENAATHNSIPNDISETSSNQTVHIIGPVTLDVSRGTLERSSGRNRILSSSEYFNILNFAPNPVPNNDIYDHATLMNTDAESSNLCSQV